jgi:urease accessory protein
MKAALHIQVAASGSASFLQNSFCTTPFKVMNITEEKNSKQLQLMLMSSSPGILDGDVYEMKVEVAENASLQLHTQAYQRLFQMKGEATQQLNVNVANGASFVFLPHPSVPHQHSSFVSRNTFYLSNYCQFIFGEVLTCGRKLNGEAFLFTKYHSITELYFHNKLVIKENLLMQPAIIDVHAIGQLEGYSHQASMIYLQENIDVKNLQSLILELLTEEKDLAIGISAAPISGLIIRLLGNGAEQLYNCLQNIQTLLNTKNSNTEQYAN